MNKSQSFHYAHVDQEFLVTSLRPEGRIFVSEDPESTSHDRAARIALTTLDMARRLGIETPSHRVFDDLPYSSNSDTLVFDAPILSNLLGRDVFFLRGWKQFQSCIKGFNALGLMAEHVVDWLQKFQSSTTAEREMATNEFLAAHELSASFEVAGSVINEIDLALWHCFSGRTIVCSTSSNMGVSLHEILRLMQTRTQKCRVGEYTILRPTEGGLVIWCPDERADFMNPEKTRLLRSLESELPELTRLRTYINRQQRDPGALADALAFGGYFFPTNPQSATELQNLLFGALAADGEDVSDAVARAISNKMTLDTLSSLGCRIDSDDLTIAVRRGVEGGIHGLMLPYWIMLEEMCSLRSSYGLETWNQASIGAALAAAVLAESIITEPNSLASSTRERFSDSFPNITREMLGKPREFSQRDIVGVFDIANIQSLAQLLGVTTDRHKAGRSTAFVGLGSSSYSNGNRCFEVLDNSAQSGGPFAGRNSFLPATHTLNPVAQALIFGEDSARVARTEKLLRPRDLRTISQHVKKTESAGAAALAGILLKLLDEGDLTVFELALCLHQMGFDSSTFLRFHFTSISYDSVEVFIQSAYEEGPYMGQFAKDLLTLLDWPIDGLRQHAARQVESRTTKSRSERALVVYLTGDNCDQPSSELLNDISPRREAGY
jgi:hypothetical protein